jgi:hypothetical protein
MKWASYLVNEMEKDYREAQDQGYEFHFSWLLVLIAFVTYTIPKGAKFHEVEPTKTMAAWLSTFWYTNFMAK